jgi:FkbM family methyltransferase
MIERKDKFWKGKKVDRVYFHDMEYLFDPDLYDLAMSMMITWDHERKSREWFFQSLKEDDVVVDVGACCGSWSLPAAAMGAKVYAVERGEPQLTALKEYVKMNNFKYDIKIVEELLYNTKTEVNFNNWQMTESIVRVLLPDTPIPDEVMTCTFDELFLDLERIDYVKIDVEGVEFEVLHGAVKSIRKFKPNLMVELHTMLHNKGPQNLDNFIDSFDLGYKHRWEDQRGYWHTYHYLVP